MTVPVEPVALATTLAIPSLIKHLPKETTIGDNFVKIRTKEWMKPKILPKRMERRRKKKI